MSAASQNYEAPLADADSQTTEAERSHPAECQDCWWESVRRAEHVRASMVMLVMLVMMGSDRVAFPSKATIRDRTGYGEARVNSGLDALVKAGLLVPAGSSPTDRGGRAVARYVVQPVCSQRPVSPTTSALGSVPEQPPQRRAKGGSTAGQRLVKGRSPPRNQPLVKSRRVKVSQSVKTVHRVHLRSR